MTWRRFGVREVPPPSGPRGPSDDGPGWTRPATIVAVVGLVLTAAGLFAKGQIFGGGDTSTHTARLTLEEVVIRNGAYVANGIGPHGQQTLASLPTIDMTLLNHGEGRALVTAADISVLAVTELPVCFAAGGGDVPTSPPETIVLPFAPSAGERVIHHDLHQQAGPREADRIVFRFRQSPATFNEAQLYVLGIVLLLDGGRSIDAGSFVLALPAMLDRWGDTLPEDATRLKEIEQQVPPGQRTAIAWCYRRNMAEVRRLTAMAGSRSAEVGSLSQLTAAANWKSFVLPSPPRDAAMELIDGDVSLVPEAVFAAQQTHDPAFVRLIRARGAQALVADARADLDNDQLDLAARRARLAIQIAPNPDAEDVLAAVRRRAGRPPQHHG